VDEIVPSKSTTRIVGIDILGPLPETKRGNRFLMVITDRFSKATNVVPLQNITADDGAPAFFVHWVSCFGPPLILLSDNGGQFAARMFQAVCSIMGVKQFVRLNVPPPD
jgi:transposase InsO family protein